MNKSILKFRLTGINLRTMQLETSEVFCGDVDEAAIFTEQFRLHHRIESIEWMD